jgi:hypothetical protein
MVKVADALVEAGHDVHVVSARMVPWASRADDHVRRARRWSWEVVDYSRESAGTRAVATAVRHRLASLAARGGPSWLPERTLVNAFTRVAPELTRAAVRSGADVYFGGTSGALAVVAAAARATGKPFGVDLEDLHTAERDDEGAALHHRLAARIEYAVLPRARLVTTSSEGIAAAYRSRYGIDPVVVHNVWPLPAEPPVFTMRSGPLGFYWFSQTIGPGRGLEVLVRALGASGVEARLTVRGAAAARYATELQWIASREAPRTTVEVRPPVPPDDIPGSSAPFDIGVATEVGAVENRRLALSNKLFMYMTTGLAIAATPVESQRAVLEPLGPHVLWIDPDRPDLAAPQLRRWSHDRVALHDARKAAWKAACDRWHWEHPLERGQFLERFASAFGM